MEKELRDVEKSTGLDRLVESLAEGRLTRRDFIKGGIALGFSLSLLSGIADQYSRVFAQEDVPPELLEAVRKEGNKLNVYNWSFYIAEDTVPNFEKEFGIDVTYDTFEDSDEMLAKIQAGGSGYDVAVNEQGYVVIMKQLGLLQPLNHEWIPNMKNLKAKFVDPDYDPGNEYSIAWMWGSTGFGYNTKYTEDDLRLRGRGSWSMLFEGKEYAGKMTMLNDFGVVIGSALKYLGYSYNSEDRDQLMEAKEVLIAQKPWLKAYISGPVRKLLIAEEVWISQLWGGDVVYVSEQNPAVQYCTPKEGMELWVDNMIIPVDAPHPATAHLWMNYILRPEVEAEIANYVHYATPNEAAMPLVSEEDKRNPAVYPPDEVVAVSEFEIPYTGEALRIREEIWEELKG